MVLNMSFKNLDSTEALKYFVREKSEVLEKYFKGRIHISWNFSIERQNQIAHLHLVGNHMDYFGEASTSDLRASIEMAVDKVERQIRKHKEIVKDHLHKNGHRLPETG